ncbi:MAG: hypothetical protein LBU25_01900 [Treponema sp.]|nr:hypothetical protein [Treponema sp.]
MAKDYIPPGDADFDRRFKNLKTRGAAKTSCLTPHSRGTGCGLPRRVYRWARGL